MKNSISILTATLIAATLSTSLQAEDTKPKRSLKGSMELKYNVLPQKADTFLEIFTKGEFYGRLRSNSFWWDYNDVTLDPKDNYASGLGGSFIYKTAPFHGIGTTLGAYYTYAVNALPQADIGNTKAGKDTFSRYNVAENNDYSLFSLAQASIDYTIGKTKLKYGAQIFESVFTRSNDTKMIPNTFNGLTIVNNDIEGTKIRAAYFTSQKLRDHDTFHDVVTFNDGSGGANANWNNNDDSAVHKGLSYASFTAAGQSTTNSLAVVTAKSKFGKNLKTEVSYAMVPNVVGNLALEAHYTINAGKTKIIPGFRYMAQMDQGGGAIGGATLKGGGLAAGFDKLTGYTQTTDLTGGLFAARIDVKPEGMFKYRLGYSHINDQADIVAPWRGFPTGGFTRAMAQYNWYANTDTYMLRLDGKITKDIKFLVRYAIQDFDDAKTAVQADTNIIHTDWMFNLRSLVAGLEAKIRVGIVTDQDTGTKADGSYNEYRFELNYLF